MKSVFAEPIWLKAVPHDAYLGHDRWEHPIIMQPVHKSTSNYSLFAGANAPAPGVVVDCSNAMNSNDAVRVSKERRWRGREPLYSTICELSSVLFPAPGLQSIRKPGAYSGRVGLWHKRSVTAYSVTAYCSAGRSVICCPEEVFWTLIIQRRCLPSTTRRPRSSRKDLWGLQYWACRSDARLIVHWNSSR